MCVRVSYKKRGKPFKLEMREGRETGPFRWFTDLVLNVLVMLQMSVSS